MGHADATRTDVVAPTSAAATANPTRQRWQWVTGLALVGAAFLMAGIALLGPAAAPFGPIDEWWHATVSYPNTPAPQLLLDLLNAFGRPPGLVIWLGLIVVLLVRRRPWGALYALTSFVAANLLAQLIKNVVDRPRPADPLVIVDHGSMPSGHVVGAAVFIVVLAALARRGFTAYGLVAGVAFVAAMAWSRTWVNAHWITDTITGAMLGAGTALLLWWAFAPLLARDRDRALERAERRSSTTQSTLTVG